MNNLCMGRNLRAEHAPETDIGLQSFGTGGGGRSGYRTRRRGYVTYDISKGFPLRASDLGGVRVIADCVRWCV